MSSEKFELQEDDKKSLKQFVRKSKEELRAQVLLLLDKGLKNIEVARILDLSPNTVGNIKKRYLEGGCSNALYDKPRSGQPKKYGIIEETVVVALACTKAPEGYKRWTVRLLAKTLKKEHGFQSITHQSVHYILKKNNIKPWKRKMWCITEIDEEYRKRMYTILRLYSESYNPQYPIICLDEKHKPLIGDVKNNIPMKPGSPEKYDYSYKRNGTANIFIAIAFKAGIRDITVTDRRTKKDFALYIKHLVDNVFPEAKKLRIVLDNLNTHTYRSILETFEFHEARELIQKIEFYYTPKHASWLNIAEIEINAMDTQCTGRRICNKDLLISETKAYQNYRNENKCKINWNFTREDADEKLSKCYSVA